MKIRNKILFYFSSTIVALTAISLGIVFYLFSEYREEEFQQQQNERIKQTIDLITEFKQMSEEISEAIDQQTIHDFYDEKLLIFNRSKKLIFSSLDDLPISRANEILNQLSPSKRWIETKDGDYDLIGVYIENHNESYYAVSKAYDAFGYSKKNFLGKVLIGILFATIAIVVLLSLYLSNIISKPIRDLSEQLNQYDPNKERNAPIILKTSTLELQNLTDRFNELLKRTNDAFSYQKHTVNHISHELKTPLAILVSELERLDNSNDAEVIKSGLNHQIIRAKSLGGIINTLLEIAKLESGQALKKHPVRIDELLFDIVEKINIIHENFNFELNYQTTDVDEKQLTIEVDRDLIQHAFQNLFLNCVVYSDNSRAEIVIDCSETNTLKISISNSGKIIKKEEEQYLFTRFFRGKNSTNKAGFGLGLVLTQKIIGLHDGTIHYRSENGFNVFEIIWKKQ